jgi:hypothetical protein
MIKVKEMGGGVMSKEERWDELAKALGRFYEIERVGIMAFGASQDMVRVYVVVYGNVDDEELRGKLKEVEEGIVKEFSEFVFDFCYV